MTTYLGEDYTVKATITDKDGTLIDPDSHSITLKDPSGVSRATSPTPSKIGLGVWEKTFTIPDDGSVGVWTIEWRVYIGAESELERFGFWVSA